MTESNKYSQTWDLDSLYSHPSGDEFRETFDAVAADLRSLAERAGRLPEVKASDTSVTEWKSFLSDFQATDARLGELNSFIGCHAAADANESLFQQYEGQLARLSPLRAEIATNLEFALRAASDEQFSAFCKSDDVLNRLWFFLEESRRNAAYRLPREQELLAADLGVDGIHAWGRLYDRASGGLRVEVMERGEVVSKSPGQVQCDSAERTVRENNFFAANRAWQTIGDTCADAINHIAGTRLTIYSRLDVQDHLDVPLRFNRMRRETLDAMWTAISDRKSMLLDYLKRKAELLGIDRLAWYDQQAPLPSPGGRDSLSYDDACDTVVRTMNAFSPEFGQFAQMAIDERWIEAENRSGKRQGGFCTGFGEQKQSRIFMTFTDSSDSMSTLAHELGHAYHSWVLRDEPIVLQEYPMNLAETASTFAEAVLGAERLNTCDSVDERRRILDQMLSDAVAFLMNIHARFIFEDRFHRERRDGELTSSRLSELMLDAQKTAYLDALADYGWNESFWISKLHFYISSYPFYNFPYTFGYLLSLGLFALAAEQPDGFPERYRKLLIATGCMDAEDAVRQSFGDNLSEPAFWHRSLDVVQQRVSDFLAT